jgi:hypothetical protein
MTPEQMTTLRTHAAAIAAALHYPPASRLDSLRRAFAAAGDLLTATLRQDSYAVHAALEESATWLLLSLPAGVSDEAQPRDATTADGAAASVALAYQLYIRPCAPSDADLFTLYALADIAAYPNFDLATALASEAHYAANQRSAVNLAATGD